MRFIMKHDVFIEIAGWGYADGILFSRIAKDSSHRYQAGAVFILHAPQQHEITHSQPIALGKFFMNQHFVPACVSDGISFD